jgi:hypothetical protein
MSQSPTEPSVYTWQPEGGVQYYQWKAGTYYWQASHCFVYGPFGEFTPTAYSPVWQFVVTPIPPPEAISPADGAMIPIGTTVEFVVHSVVSRLTPESGWLPDYETRIEISETSGRPLQYPSWNFASADGSLLYFDWHAGPPVIKYPGTINWTPFRVDCKAEPNNACSVPGTTHSLTIVGSETSAPPSTPVGKTGPSKCSGPRETFGVINHRVRCLHAGEFCSWRFRRQYRRYHYACVRKGRHYRLVRRR